LFISDLRQVLRAGTTPMAPRSAFLFSAYAKTATNFGLTRAMLASFYCGGLTMKLPDNARLALTLYFKSPSLGKIVVIDVDASPDDDGEVERFSEGIAELTRRWCAALNGMHKVKDFRPETRMEVGTYLQRRDYVDRGRTVGKSTRGSISAALGPRAASASSVRNSLRELGSRYFAMPRRALAVLRSRPRSRSPERWRASERE
jgi:hypothetical protein